MPASDSSVFVVVGTGPAGLAAVRSFREHDRQARVVLIGGEAHPPYARPPLTKDFLRGESELAELWLESDDWYAAHDVELRLGMRVTDLDPDARKLRMADDSVLAYDTLLLATGSRPRPLPVPGGDHPELIYVRELDSGHRLRELTGRPNRRIGVIGSGFIGCEVAASLAATGSSVVLLTDETHPHTSRLGAEVGREIAGWLTEAGVELRTGSGVARIESADGRWRVELADGEVVTVDELVAGGGAEPNLDLGRAAGLSTESGGLATDDRMRTTRAGILAAGDIAYARNAAAGRSLRVEHWGDAEGQGEVAGATAAGVEASWDSPPGFWSGIGDRTLKYSAWGGDWDRSVRTGSGDSWAVWYGQGSGLVGVLAHNDDDAYERGQRLLTEGVSFDEAIAR